MSDWSRPYEIDRPRPAGSISSSLGVRPGLTSYAAGSNEMRGTDIIAEYLVKERVPYILGYAGHGAIGLLDGLFKIKDRISTFRRALSKPRDLWRTSIFV